MIESMKSNNFDINKYKQHRTSIFPTFGETNRKQTLNVNKTPLRLKSAVTDRDDGGLVYGRRILARPAKSAGLSKPNENKLEWHKFNNSQYDENTIYNKHPSLTHTAEQIRRNLYRYCINNFDETNELLKTKENDTNDVKYAAAKIKELLRKIDDKNLFEKHVESGGLKKQKEVKRKVSSIEQETLQIEEEVNDDRRRSSTIKPKYSIVSHASDASTSQDRFHEFSMERKSSDAIKMGKHAKLEQSFDDITNALQVTIGDSRELETKESLSLSNLNEINDDKYDTITDKELEEIEEKSHVTKPTVEKKDKDEKIKRIDFDEKEDLNYYERNKTKFMKNTEQAHKSIYNFSRIAAAKLDKRHPTFLPPQMRTLDELNLNGESIRRLLRKNYLLANKNAIDDDDDDENEEEYSKKYKINSKKRQTYMKLIKIMYSKAIKNQNEMEHVLKRSNQTHAHHLQQKHINFDLDDRQQQQQQQQGQRHLDLINITNNENLSENGDYTTTFVTQENNIIHNVENRVKNMFRVSMPCSINVSNYEIFIPNSETKALTQRIMTPSSLSDSSSRTSTPTNNVVQIHEIIPLTNESLMSKRPVVESKALSTLWKNYANRTRMPKITSE